jgi:hypothetical protein
LAQGLEGKCRAIRSAHGSGACRRSGVVHVARVHRSSHMVQIGIGQHRVLKSATQEGNNATFMILGTGVEDGGD